MTDRDAEEARGRRIAAGQEEIEDVLSERVCRAINRRIASSLRQVAAAIERNYSPGWYGMGGPQDGDDVPPSFSARRAAEDIQRVADLMSPETK